MIIAATPIKKPRVVHRCADCHEPIDGKKLRLYGYACTGDRPYTMYLHPHCMDWESEQPMSKKVGKEFK